MHYIMATALVKKEGQDQLYSHFHNSLREYSGTAKKERTIFDRYNKP